MTNDDQWRLFRKLVHQFFNETVCENEHVTLQNAEAVHMLRDICIAPEQMMSYPKRFSNSIIMSLGEAAFSCFRHVSKEHWTEFERLNQFIVLVFGVRSPTVTTPHLVGVYEIMDEWSNVIETGATPPVDIFPALKWVPERLLGNWITRSRNVGKATDRLYTRMVSHVIQRRTQLGSRHSFLDAVLDQDELAGNLTANQLNFLGGILTEGGSDTSSSIILAFVQAMTNFPHVQKKAQRKLDSVVGEDRSSLWSDYAQLPYISMTVKETMRWRPVPPLAFPHAVSEGKKKPPSLSSPRPAPEFASRDFPPVLAS